MPCPKNLAGNFKNKLRTRPIVELICQICVVSACRPERNSELPLLDAAKQQCLLRLLENATTICTLSRSGRRVSELAQEHCLSPEFAAEFLVVDPVPLAVLLSLKTPTISVRGRCRASVPPITQVGHAKSALVLNSLSVCRLNPVNACGWPGQADASMGCPALIVSAQFRTRNSSGHATRKYINSGLSPSQQALSKLAWKLRNSLALR